MQQQFYLGIVEDRKNDPLKLGRVRVRVFGVHSESLDDVPTESLPWAISLMPATSASISGIGETVAYVEGTLVFLFFQDGESKQQPVILGSAPGIPLGKSPFGSAGTYLTETFDDVTPVEPEIDLVNDGSNSAADDSGETCPPRGTVFFDQAQTYYGIDSLYGGAGDRVLLKRNEERTPENAPAGYVRRFDSQDNVFYYTSEHVTPDGKYWYDDETIASGPRCTMGGVKSVERSTDGEFRPLYAGQYGDNRDAIYFDSMTPEQKAEWDNELKIARAADEGRERRWLRYINQDGSAVTTVTPETRKYYFRSEHVKWTTGWGGSYRAEKFYYDDITSTNNNNLKGSSPTVSAKSILYDSPLQGYKGLPDIYENGYKVYEDVVVVSQDGNSYDDSIDISSRFLRNYDSVTSGPGLGGGTVYQYTPAYRYYFRSEHIDSNGKYWYDTPTIPDSGTSPNTVAGTQKPKSSGVDITRAVAKYGVIVETVYKTLIDFGIKNNSAAIAILSNIGKESKFVPRREDMTYKTIKQLKAIFPSKFGSMTDSQITPYLNNEVKLANFVYANSDGNGDEASGDGYKYRGGGLIQLTKKSNYSSIGTSLGIDLVSRPELVLQAETASKVVAQYFINRYGGANRVSFASVDEALTNVTKKVNPGGFANDYPKVLEESKLYVNNEQLADDQQAEIGNPNDPENDIKPDASQEEINNGLISKRSYSTNNLGFKDPSEKYPLGSLLREPDTSRLTRRIVNQTSVATKRKNRRTNIQSTGKDKFSEPPAAYNAQYPYNKVFTSESGHVMEFDDTHGCERINIFHTSGTFVEIDAKGNQVNKIIGDNFSITEKNGYIYIDGTARVSIGGDVKLSIGGNLDIDVGGDINYTVKGSINTKVGKDTVTNITGKSLYNIKGTTVNNYTGACTNNSPSTIVFTSKLLNLYSTSNVNIAAPGNIAIDGSKIYLNSSNTATSNIIAPIIPPVLLPTNTSTTNIVYNLPESFVDGEIVKFDDVSESQIYEHRQKAISSGIITQRQIDDGDKIVADKSKDSKTKKDATVPTNTPAPLPESCAAFADKTNIPETLQLSKSFNLAMLSTKAVVSHYTVKSQRGLKEHEIVCNLKKVAENCLDPIKVKYPNMFVTSGFRTGAGTSQHELGEAIDMQFTGVTKSDYYDIAVWIKNNVIFDKLLLEYKTTGSGLPWIHISYRTNPRKEIYTFMNNAKVSSDIRKLQ